VGEPQPTSSGKAHAGERPERAWKRAVFLLVAGACATPWVSLPIALALGIVAAFAGVTAFPNASKKLSRVLIQVCIVLLGLRLDLGELARAAWDGLALAMGTILGACALGLLLGRVLRTGREISTLVTSGTAICGGSAIAAVGSSIRASSSGMAIATGAVFVLNAVALFVFPPIARALHLTDVQFGAWAGVAIHDMSSVVGAATAFDRAALSSGMPAHALDHANIVKLTRVVWILPLALAARWWFARDKACEAQVSSSGRAAVPFPWFILAFLGASALRTALPALGAHAPTIAKSAGLGFQVALFLIGSALSPSTLRHVGWRALVQAVVLWIALAGATLAVVKLTSR
jgi:uncharacterized integral membrane protein (TIGR00698 family)